jgi:hydroxymethylglutaryl-CoA lyase
MAESVTIVECPRDAFQGLPRFIPTPVKIDYLLSLLKAGFTHIDFGSFVSSRAVPQMRDTEQVLEAVKPFLGDSTLIAIIPNLKGLDKIIQVGGIRCAGYPLSLSGTFQERNLHQDLEESWKVVETLVDRAKVQNIELTIYISMAFGNPYGDPWSPQQVLRFVEELVKKGIRQVSLADTVGVAKPDVVRSVVSECLKSFPEAQFGVHLHSRADKWEEPVIAAFQAGCRRFDGALHGLGGCPFAEDTLVGNIPTERVIHRFNQLGIRTGLSQETLQRPLAEAAKILERYGKQGVEDGE